jgi:hypothetical protein
MEDSRRDFPAFFVLTAPLRWDLLFFHRVLREAFVFFELGMTLILLLASQTSACPATSRCRGVLCDERGSDSGVAG